MYGQWIFGPNLFLLIEKLNVAKDYIDFFFFFIRYIYIYIFLTLILILNFLKIEYCPFSRKDLGICMIVACMVT